MKIQFVTYRTSAFFIPEIPTPEEIVLRQRVMTASIQGVKVQNLTDPIHFSIENINVSNTIAKLIVSSNFIIMNIFITIKTNYSLIE